MTARVDLSQFKPVHEICAIGEVPSFIAMSPERTKEIMMQTGLCNISIAIADDEYIARSIKEANQEIDKRETEIFELEKKLLTLNGLKRQMDKKSGIYQRDTSPTNGAR